MSRRFAGQRRPFKPFRAAVFLLLIVVSPVLTSCGENTDSFFALDTSISIKIKGSEEDLAALKDEICAFDALFSPNGTQSAIAALNREKKVSDEWAFDVLKEAEEYRVLTGGAFDPRLGALSSLWGFGTGKTAVPPQDKIASLLEKSLASEFDFDGKTKTVSLSGEAVVDLGAVGKGALADRLREICEERGIGSALISLGGNLTVVGKKAGGKARTIAILGPDGSSYACFIEAADTHIVTSGVYQRFFEQDGKRYCHVLDPSTGSPVDNELSSVTIVSENGAYADALSTALLVMGGEKALAFWETRRDFEAIFIRKDGEVFSTGIAYTLP